MRLTWRDGTATLAAGAAVVLVAAVTVLVTANRAMLATLVTATVALWLIATIRHAIAGAKRADEPATLEPLSMAGR